MDDEEPLNTKDITHLISGDTFDFDEEGELQIPETTENPGMEGMEETTPQELHPLVGIMDMVISSTAEPLRRRGYPQPNLSIWEEWGKPNLSKAFHQYMPTTSGAGAAVNSPLFAGLLGAGALVLAFLPVILHYMEKKKEEENAEKVLIEQQRGVMEPTAIVTQPTQQSQPMPQAVQQPQQRRDEPAPDVAKIKTKDNPAPPQIVKLPGGGDEAQAVPMFEIMARTAEQPI